MKSSNLVLTKFLSGLILLGLCLDGSTALAQQGRVTPRRPAPARRSVPAILSSDPLFPGEDDLSNLQIPLERPAPARPVVQAPQPSQPPRRFSNENEPRADIASHSAQGQENRATERARDGAFQFGDEQVVGQRPNGWSGERGFIPRLGQECIDTRLAPVLQGRVTTNTQTRIVNPPRDRNGTEMVDSNDQREVNAMVLNGEFNTTTNGVLDTSIADGYRYRASQREILLRTRQLNATQVNSDGTTTETYNDPLVVVQTTVPVVQINEDRQAIAQAFIATLRCENKCLSEKDAAYLVNECFRVAENLPTSTNSADIFASLPSCTNAQLRAAAMRGEFEFSQQTGYNMVTDQPICDKGIHTQQFSAFSGIDIALVMDNSGSMATLGQEVVRDVFPQLLAQVRDLRPSARMIMMTQSHSTEATRILDVDSDQFLTNAEQTRLAYVAASTSVFQEERLFDAANINLSGSAAHARPRADLLTIFLTDEHDMSAMDGLQFVKGMRSLTTGPFTVVATHRSGDYDAHLGEAIDLTHGAYLDLSAADLGRKLNEYVQEYINPRRPRELPLNEDMSEIFRVSANGVALTPDQYVVNDQRTISILPGALTPGIPTVIDVFYLPSGMRIPTDPVAEPASAEAPSLAHLLGQAQGPENRPAPAPERLPSEQILDLMDQVLNRQAAPVTPAAPATPSPRPARPRATASPARVGSAAAPSPVRR